MIEPQLLKLSPVQTRADLIVTDIFRHERGLHAFLTHASVFAIAEIESGWREQIISFDGLGSIGLMQCLPAVAVENGVRGRQDDAFCSLLAGMRHLSKGCWYMNGRGIHANEAYVQAYNVGNYGYAEKNRRNLRYYEKWQKAHRKWVAHFLADAGGGRPR